MANDGKEITITKEITVREVDVTRPGRLDEGVVILNRVKKKIGAE